MKRNRKTYQAEYFQRKNNDPVWRARRLRKIRAWKLSKKGDQNLSQSKGRVRREAGLTIRKISNDD